MKMRDRFSLGYKVLLIDHQALIERLSNKEVGS